VEFFVPLRNKIPAHFPKLAAQKQRLDALLVERGLAENRTKARALIMAGQVWIGERRGDKPGSLVPSDAKLRVEGGLRYVSRGGLKLERALEHFQLSVQGKICADIGASTGGFTDCLLQAGADKVYAIDVGYGQLHPKLRSDPRVVVRERLNARYLSDADLPLVDVATVDVSFISLRQIIPSLLKRLRPTGLLVTLVKPQFEVGRSKVGKGGVVRDSAAREQVIADIITFLAEAGLQVLGQVDSPIAGPAGNLEALVAARQPGPEREIERGRVKPG
jgi:23S rRNA (cytidine1920-2'-O)/16S rRNA (cytidine1409-2'-O)-methyltransferase